MGNESMGSGSQARWPPCPCGKKSLKNPILRTERPMTVKLGMQQ